LHYSIYSKLTRVVLPSIVAVYFISCQGSEKSKTDLGISLKNDVTFLASDELEGREIGTTGEKKAAAYIVDRFQAIGLSPAGTDGFYQRFEVTPAMNPHEQAKIGTDGDSINIIGNNIIALIDNREMN